MYRDTICIHVTGYSTFSDHDFSRRNVYNMVLVHCKLSHFVSQNSGTLQVCGSSAPTLPRVVKLHVLAKELLPNL